MKIISEILMLMPAATFVFIMLMVRRFKTLRNYLLFAMAALFTAFILMLVGIHMQMNQ